MRSGGGLNRCYAEFFASDKPIEQTDVEIFDQVADKIKGNVELSVLEQRFLNGLIRKYKPKKILEIGVAKGGSAAIILNAIKDDPKAHLYSIDKTKECYSRSKKATGFVVSEKTPELKNKWTLYTGGITCDFIEKIGKDIDFVFIDTVHVAPGEMLDFLMVLPFLKKGAIVAFHDIGLHLTNWPKKQPIRPKLYHSNNQIFAYAKGKKIIPTEEKDRVFYNIGAIELDKDQETRYWDYFFPLSFHWDYMPEEKDLNKIRSFLAKYYDEEYIKIFDEALNQNKIYLSDHEVHPAVQELDSCYNTK
ncbi:MAG: class I SAM-dependent methyltransferase [Alphaproteobacteria bacterium]|nr:class I SAM-dependent methyltransferase [Alphaproteobacteria bacterium]